MVDDLARPVAGVGDDDGKPFFAGMGEALEGFAGYGACFVGFSGGNSERVGDDAEGVGFFQRRIRQTDGLPKVHVAVVKVELDAVGGEDLGFDGAETHARPGVGDEQSGDEEHPPGFVADEDVAEGMGRVVGGVGGLEHDLRPEEADDGPTHEAVRVLEGVVHQHAHAWVGEYEHDHEHGDDGVAEEVDVTADGIERTFLGAVVHGEQDKVDGVPEGGGHGTARVKTAVRVDLGGQSARPEWENLSPGTKDPEESVDDVLVADDNGHQDVGCDGRNSLLVSENWAVLNARTDDEPEHSRHVTHEG